MHNAFPKKTRSCFKNYNKVSLIDNDENSVYAIKSISFLKKSADEEKSESYLNSDLQPTSTKLTTKFKINDSVSISSYTNEGFKILGFL